MKQSSETVPASFGREKPDQRTGFLLQWTHQRTRRAFNEALRTLDIETRHFGVLTLLADQPGLRQKEIVDRLELDKSSVVIIIDDLERLGVARRNPDPHDRRAHIVQITAEGRKRLHVAEGIAACLGRKLFAGLTKYDREQLDRALLRIIANCGNLNWGKQ